MGDGKCRRRGRGHWARFRNVAGAFPATEPGKLPPYGAYVDGEDALK